MLRDAGWSACCGEWCCVKLRDAVWCAVPCVFALSITFSLQFIHPTAMGKVEWLLVVVLAISSCCLAQNENGYNVVQMIQV